MRILRTADHAEVDMHVRTGLALVSRRSKSYGSSVTASDDAVTLELFRLTARKLKHSRPRRTPTSVPPGPSARRNLPRGNRLGRDNGVPEKSSVLENMRVRYARGEARSSAQRAMRVSGWSYGAHARSGQSRCNRNVHGDAHTQTVARTPAAPDEESRRETERAQPHGTGRGRRPTALAPRPGAATRAV